MSVLKTIKKFLGRFFHFLLRGYHLPVFLSLLSTIFAFWIYTTNQSAVRTMMARVDNLLYDQRFNLMLDEVPRSDHKIVIVDYDQKSLNAEGQWPWSRFKIGDLVTQLADGGALVIGFDVFFPEYERNLAREVSQHMTKGRVDINAELLPQLESLGQILDGDRYFAQQMQNTDVALGFSFRPNEALQKGILPRPIARLDETLSERLVLQEMQGYEGNVDILQNGASGAGFFDTRPDIDGVIRRSPLILQYRNQLYPSLALEMARLYYFEDSFGLNTETDPTGLFTRVTGVRMGGINIPTDEVGQVLVPYIGPSNLGESGTYPYISATDVLNDTLTDEEREALFNSLVLVGTTATGLFDLRSTPLEAIFPGVEVHANILNAILNSTPVFAVDEGSSAAGNSAVGNILNSLDPAQVNPFPSRPDWQNGAVIAVLVLLGMLLSFIYPRLGPALLTLSSLSFMLGIMALNFKLWSDFHLDISLFILLFLIMLITIVNMGFGFLKEGLSKRAIKGMFDQYVPPAHIDAMLNDPDNYNFEGESKELSVLFSDIRNFTSISESLSAVQLKTLLNDFFTPITGIIFDHHGTIDKYVGDMVMAFWGAPLEDQNHPNHAVSAALKMLEKVDELKPEFLENGLPEVNIGVGINTGMMNVGDMGSTYRRSYTVLGDAVNLGSRLESITKFYGVKLLIGEETYDRIEGFLCRLVDKVQVKGKENSIRIYQPLCLEADAPEDLLGLVDEYHRAYDKYVKQNWDEAVRMFENLREKDPDTKLYAVYLERIPDLRSQHLGVDWDGTFRHTTK